MEPSTMIAVFLPLIVLFAVIIPQRQAIKSCIVKRRKRGGLKMSNELLKKYIGQTCIIMTGSFGSQVNGKIIDVVDSWIEIETKKGTQLINADYAVNIVPVNK